MSKNIELVEKITSDEQTLIAIPKIDGFFKNALYNNMIKNLKKDSVNNIFANACSAIKYFAVPLLNKQNISKILCLGKVQSGKTSFFIATTSLAFDNGYSLVYLMGGTKINLKDQNLQRIEFDFSNNERVKILNLNHTSAQEIRGYLESDHKVVVVVLKHASKNTNLGKMHKIIQETSNIPSVIIDDEGDEFTPGAPKLKDKNSNASKTHDKISDILYSLKCATFLSVTATPQANLLISTIDTLSPDYLTLVEPSSEYTGGNAFFDFENNSHVVNISDADDFIDSIPKTFKDAFNFFILCCCISRCKYADDKQYSMLIHPSSLTLVHNVICERISDFFKVFKTFFDEENSPTYVETINTIKEQFNEFCAIFSCDYSFEDIIKHINFVLSKISLNVLNSKTNHEINENLYNIYIGGNMLGRGITFKNLIVTYIYRDSKETAIDTLYQRARWLGYKYEYFDFCKVFMTISLQKKFISTVDSENEMWNMIRAFLLSNLSIKKFPRHFKLNNNQLILTRKTVSRTIEYERINPGYNSDNSIDLTIEQKNDNKNLYLKFIENWEKHGITKQFGLNTHQTHFIIKMKFSDFFNDFIEHYNFPRGSVFGKLGFKKMLNSIKENNLNDEITIVVMRYKTGQYRSLRNNGKTISLLPQGWDFNSKYPGDKFLDELSSIWHIQIHLVYNNKEDPTNFIPKLAMNNPISTESFRMVTGDNYYESF